MKEEKQVQNETTEPKTNPNIDVGQIMSQLGFVPPQDIPEESTEEHSDFILIPDMFLQCKKTTKNGRTYKDYILHGKLLDVPVEIFVRPGKSSSGFTDVNSYKLLDIVFGSSDVSLFAVRIIRRTDRYTNRTTTSMEYVAYLKDAKTGMEIYAPLRFETVSDNAMLKQLLTCSNKVHDLNLPL